MKILIAGIAFFSLFTVQAELYKSLDENGEVVYSDEPPTNSAKPYLPPAITVTPPIKYIPKKTLATAKPAPVGYQLFRFSKPEANSHVRDKTGATDYTLSLIPDLKTKLGHYVNVRLGDKVIASQASSLSGSVRDLEKGSHTLMAEICDQDGKVLRSASVTFNLHTANKNPNPATKPAAQ